MISTGLSRPWKESDLEVPACRQLLSSVESGVEEQMVEEVVVQTESLIAVLVFLEKYLVFGRKMLASFFFDFSGEGFPRTGEEEWMVRYLLPPQGENEGAPPDGP